MATSTQIYRIVFKGDTRINDNIDMTNRAMSVSHMFFAFEFGRTYYMAKGRGLVAFKVHAVQYSNKRNRYLVETAGEKPTWKDETYFSTPVVFTSVEEYMRYIKDEASGSWLKQCYDGRLSLLVSYEDYFSIPRGGYAGDGTYALNPLKGWWIWDGDWAKPMEITGMNSITAGYVATSEGLTVILPDGLRDRIFPTMGDCIKAHMEGFTVNDFAEEREDISALLGLEDATPRKVAEMRLTMTIEEVR